MTITIDNSAVGTAGNAGASVAVTMTIAAGATLLLVFAQENTGSGGTFGNGVTCGASSCTQLNAQEVLFSVPDYINAEIWYLLNPPSGSQTITANAANFVFRAGGAAICAVSLFGTKATAPMVNQGVAGGAVTVSSVSLNTSGSDTAGSLLFGGLCAWDNGGGGNPTNGTSLMATEPHTVAVFMASYIAATSGTDTLSYANGTGTWGAYTGGLAEVLAAPAAGPVPSPGSYSSVHCSPTRWARRLGGLLAPDDLRRRRSGLLLPA